MRKGFRPTPNQFRNSMKIMSGNKTNASLRDIEEKDDKELEEKEAVIVSIEKDKMHGNGWTVQDQTGQTYKCSCQSNLYEVPKSKEKGGILYPTETVKCKIKINPVLNINTITEIVTNDSKSTKTKNKDDKGKTQTETKKLDINKWTHKGQDTTVIAKPMSAISISNGAITFNFDNKNKVTIDKDQTKIEGKLDLPAGTTVDGKAIDEKDLDKALTRTTQPKKTSTYDYVNGKSEGVPVQATIQKAKQDIFSRQEKVVDNIMNHKQIPEETLKLPLLSETIDDDGNVTGSAVDTLTVYPDGIVTIKSNSGDGKRNIYCTQNWITSYEKNTITITVSKLCDYCVEHADSTVTYIDYCPNPQCQQWHSLYEVNGDIVCKYCGTKYCGTCGHNQTSNYLGNLKKYQDNYIIGNGLNCEYCEDILEPEKSKEYVNYCPICKKWDSIEIAVKSVNGSMSNQAYCNECGTYYCLTCGTSQLGFDKESTGNALNYENYIEKMKKLLYIKES